jgi:hypothetical protein
VPFAVCRLPFAVCRLPFASYQLPVASRQAAQSPAAPLTRVEVKASRTFVEGSLFSRDGE